MKYARFPMLTLYIWSCGHSKTPPTVATLLQVLRNTCMANRGQTWRQIWPYLHHWTILLTSESQRLCNVFIWGTLYTIYETSQKQPVLIYTKPFICLCTYPKPGTSTE